MKNILRVLIVILGFGAIVQAASNAKDVGNKEKKEVKTQTRETAKQPTI